MDIQVVYLRDVMRVSSVANVAGMVPRTIDIRGPDFRNVVKVEINEEPAAAFAVVSQTQILAQVPLNQERAIVRNVAVLSSDFTKTNVSQMKFEFTNNPKKVDGMMKLIQTFLLYLLRTPGSDAWFPNSGGGVMKLVGQSYARSQAGGLSASFATSVNRTKTQIMSLQAGNTRLASAEKLAAANVLSAVFDVNQTALVARMELITQAGERALVGLEL